MKYPFLNTQQGGIQNSRRSSRLTRQVCIFMEKMDVKIFLMFIVAENTGSVNIYNCNFNLSLYHFGSKLVIISFPSALRLFSMENRFVELYRG